MKTANMDIQKIKVRAELERMVYNYALLGMIENWTLPRKADTVKRLARS